MTQAEYTLFRPTFTVRGTGKAKASATWHIRFRDHLQRRQTLAGERTEHKTIVIADRLTRLIDCRRRAVPPEPALQRWIDLQPDGRRRRFAEMGIIDPAKARQDHPLIDLLIGHRDVNDVLTEPGFMQDLESRGNSPKHVSNVVTNIRGVIDAVGIVLAAELLVPGIETKIGVHLGKRRKAGEITGTTYNYIVRDLKAFARWLLRDGLLPALALGQLGRVDNAEVDAVVRRPLTLEELDLLCRGTLIRNETHHATSAKDRVLLYRLAFATGLRPSAIASFTVGSFVLDVEQPYVVTTARRNKRRQTHQQPLRAGMAKELATRFKSMKAGDKAFHLSHDPAEMLRRDLADARDAWVGAEGISSAERDRRRKSDFLADVNHQGERVTFYSLRHSFGTALADAGVPQKDIAAAMHHSTTRTTERYLHTTRQRVADVVAALPDL